jgi:hypothetical protein
MVMEDRLLGVEGMNKRIEGKAPGNRLPKVQRVQL